MTDDRSPAEVQRLMMSVFLAFIDQLHKDNPDYSYNYCFMFALRSMHFGVYGGDMTNAPPLPGTVPAEEIFGSAGAQVEATLAQLHPDKSQHWHREMAERILLGDDSDEVPEWLDRGGA